MTDISAVASRVLDEGSRPIIKDNYEQRLDYFAQELAGKDREYQAQVIAEVMRQDPGAFDSWLKSDRLQDLVAEGLVTRQEADDLLAGFAHGLEDGTIAADALPGEFVKHTSQDMITSYIAAQDMDDRAGFERALVAFSGIPANALPMYLQTPQYQEALQGFELGIQRHQDWYEAATVDVTITPMSPYGPGLPTTIDAPVEFSKEQLQAMREGFRADDGMLANGELLLAYPDRAERNEAVTQQYHDLSTAMSGIVGSDNANWATFAVWASDEIGRNLDGTTGIALGEAAFGDPKFWLSKGNSMLISDIGPGFQYFTETFADGQNRHLTFEQYWSNFQQEFAGRGISYLEGGSGDAELDMKNAFKAYHEAMQLHDRQQASADPAEQAQLADRRADLMLYANTLVGLQEQEIVQQDIENGLSAPLAGAAEWAGIPVDAIAARFLDFHLPSADGRGERRIDTDHDIPQQDDRVDPAGTGFTTADGRVIQLDTALRDRLASLPGDSDGGADEYDIANSGTQRWQDYGERMGSIYHLFANFQQYDALFGNPRDLFPSRAETLANDPGIYVP
jgi:hypothetical protein